jgi:hypothetical protein
MLGPYMGWAVVMSLRLMGRLWIDESLMTLASPESDSTGNLSGDLHEQFLVWNTDF